MIKKKDISDFFDFEAEAAKKSWETLMGLSVKERIHKRKTIDSVYLDREYRETSDEGCFLLRVSVGVNLADFKEGECLILHKEGMTSGIKCTLNSFEEDDAIIIEVFPANMPNNIDTYYDVPLLLDKDLVDLRQHVFYNFLNELKTDSDYWNKCLVNNHRKPAFDNKEKCSKYLDEVCESYDINLLPKQRDAIIKSIAAKDYYLIQGPPGTGKSFVLAWIILIEAAYFCHKIIVIGPNHMAINNTLLQVIKQCPGVPIYKVGQTYNAPKQFVKENDEKFSIKNFNSLNVRFCNEYDRGLILGLTSHSLYTRRANSLKCDTLIIDEAAQMTIPLALMGMIRANKVIFAGDHKQLPPIISSDEMKNEMKQSIFKHLMTEDNHTMLDVSFRMCEPICKFVSNLFYDNRVRPMKKGCSNLIISNESLFDFHTPIVIHHVDDEGKQTSDKEAKFIADAIAGFLNKGLSADEVAVLSPFRAQVANVQRYIRKQPNISNQQRIFIAVDTVDKMQGQEREVIFYSLVSGNLDYMVEMADFLYNPNKLNVGFSRAKSKLIIVGNIKQIKKVCSTRYPHVKKMIESNLVKYI